MNLNEIKQRCEAASKGGKMKNLIAKIFAALMMIFLVPVGFMVGCIWFGIRGGLEACNGFLE